MEQFLSELSHFTFYEMGEMDSIDLTRPERRYKNQIHYTIPIIGDWYVDLTIIEDFV